MATSSAFTFVLSKHCSLSVAFMVTLLVFSTLAQNVDANSCNVRCLNNGALLLPNNIFGFCRCKCQPGFAGPICQFSKRSGPQSFEDRLNMDLGFGKFKQQKRMGEAESSWDAPVDNAIWGKLLARARLAQAALQDDEDN